jgi:hypothetical protein
MYKDCIHEKSFVSVIPVILESFKVRERIQTCQEVTCSFPRGMRVDGNSFLLSS